MTTVKPKKYLGQHFLLDHNIARKIAVSLKLTECVLEIGPGKGMLTQYLLQHPNIQLKVIEIDPESVRYLRENIPAIKTNIIEGDFLKYDLDALFSEPYTIAGNFPYNISSQILFRVVEQRDKVSEVVCMLQKEVAERITAPPGSKTYGILSVFIQTWFSTEYLFTVPETVFMPRPKVKSAVIRLTRNKTMLLDCDENLFIRLVRTAFNQRRKTLRNALAEITRERKITEFPMMGKRAEQLSHGDFISLTRFFS